MRKYVLPENRPPDRLYAVLKAVAAKLVVWQVPVFCLLSIIASSDLAADEVFSPIEAISLGSYSGRLSIRDLVLKAKDLNGDGAMDLALLSPYDSTAFMVENDGTGNFEYHRTSNIGFTTNFADYADFNEDGWADLVSINRSDDTVRIALSDQDWSYINTHSFSVANNGFNFVETADLDGDGHIDIVAEGAPQTHIYFGTGDGSFERVRTLERAHRSRRPEGGMYLQDIDGNGTKDIIIIDFSSSSLDDSITGIEVFFNEGYGGFSEAVVVQTPGLSSLQTAREFALADVDYDGDLDLTYISRLDSVFFPEIVTLINSDPNHRMELVSRNSVPIVEETLSGYPSPELKDFNRDGLPDVVMQIPEAEIQAPPPYELISRVNAGNGVFLESVEFVTQYRPNGFYEAGVLYRDFNEDGFPDRLAPAFRNTSTSYQVAFGDGTGVFSNETLIEFPEETAEWILGCYYGANNIAADFDQDGDQDVIVVFGDSLWEGAKVYLYLLRNQMTALLGDMNCDSQVSFADINPFVAALSGRSAFEEQNHGCAWHRGDFDQDGNVSFADINPFITALHLALPEYSEGEIRAMVVGQDPANDDEDIDNADEGTDNEAIGSEGDSESIVPPAGDSSDSDLSGTDEREDARKRFKKAKRRLKRLKERKGKKRRVRKLRQARKELREARVAYQRLTITRS